MSESFNRPYLSLNPDDNSVVVNLLPALQNTDFTGVVMEVGEQKYKFLAHGQSLSFTVGSAVEQQYTAQLIKEGFHETIIQSHLIAMSKPTEIRFHPLSLTNSSRGVLELDRDGKPMALLDRFKFRQMATMAADMFLANYSSTYNTATLKNARMAEIGAKYGVTYTKIAYNAQTLKNAWPNNIIFPAGGEINVYYVVQAQIPGIIQGFNDTDFICNVALFYGLCDPTVDVTRMSTFNGSRGYGFYVRDLSTVSSGAGVAPSTLVDTRTELGLYTVFPQLQILKQHVMRITGSTADDVQWGSQGTGPINGLYLLVKKFRYATSQFNELSEVGFVLKFDEIDDNAFNIEEVELKSKGLKVTAADVRVLRLKSSAVVASMMLHRLTEKAVDLPVELVEYVAAHPNAAIMYTRCATPFIAPGVDILKETNLYKDAVEASFDLYSQVVIQTPSTTVKTMSNKVNEGAGKKKQIAIVNPSYGIKSVPSSWSIENVKAASCSVSSVFIVTVTTLGRSSILLDPRVAAEKAEIEFFYYMGANFTYSTTEADFLGAFFGVQSRAQLLAGFEGSGVVASAYTIDPYAFSMYGYQVFLDEITQDQRFRSMFAALYLSSKEMEAAIEGALVVSLG